MKILLLSAYDAASHRLWRESLEAMFPQWEFTTLVLPARYFAWRIRGNPLSWLDHPQLQRRDFSLCVATSMVDLATLRGLGLPALKAPSLLYFHENQFAYPEREKQKFSDEPKTVQLYAALAAEALCFNSEFNRDSFISGVVAWLKKLPDFVPAQIAARLQAKSHVLPVPIAAGGAPSRQGKLPRSFVWNHRWEYDKGPQRLLACLQALPEDLSLTVHVVGQSFRQVPEEMPVIHALLQQRGWCGTWGYQDDRQEYQRLLATSQFVLSTSEHDFQGLSILEAVAEGCIPILPARLAYPEYFPSGYLYASGGTMEDEAQAMAQHIQRALDHRSPRAPSVTHLTRGALVDRYQQLMHSLARDSMSA